MDRYITLLVGLSFYSSFFDLEGEAIMSNQSEPNMENDTLEQGRFTFSIIHQYLRSGCYPHGYTKSDKQALRKRAKFFYVQGADLFYVGGQSSKSVVTVVAR